MTGPRVVMRNFGGLGNRMIRFMVADRIARELGGWPVVGYDLSEWGMASPVEHPLQGRGFNTNWHHRIDIPAIARRAREEAVDYVEVDTFGQRLEYFADRRDHFARLFAPAPAFPVADDELAINIRAGDIVDGFHRDYTPLPLAFYHRLLAQTGLKPVFVGQLEDNWYTRALRDQFPQARYLSGTPMEDFQTLRGARNVMLAVSTFSWLAAWLSDSVQQVHMPLAGLVHPEQRPDIDLASVDDPRWQFHRFEPSYFLGNEDQKAILVDPQAGPQEWTGGAWYMGYGLSQ